MFQLCIVLLFCVSCGLAGYPDSASENDIGNNNNYGYGYSGSFSGGGMHAYSFASSNPNGIANAYSSITYSKKGISDQAQSAQNFGKTGAFAGGGNYGGAGGFGGGFSGHSFGGDFSRGFPGDTFQFIPGAGVGGSFGSDGHGASAFGSIGPDGVQQKAEVFPENPGTPNINVRFGAAENPNGFKSVFTSSSSVTTNVDGQPKTVKQASTTVNDNGKVTTYTAKSP